jgi:hypothetical protein
MQADNDPTCALGIICNGPYDFSAPLSQPFSAVHSATYMVCGQTQSSRHMLPVND